MNKGFIKISDELYKTKWNEMYVFLKDFRPTHIEFRHWENDVWYLYGVSEKFNPIKEGDLIPQYGVVFHYDENSDLLRYEFEIYN